MLRFRPRNLNLNIFQIFYTCFFLCLIATTSYAGVEDGLTWLESKTNTDGSIALEGDLTPAYQSTAEAIITYRALGQSEGVVEAQAYLDSLSLNSTENLALRFLTSTSQDPNFFSRLTELTQRQNIDGGVGTFAGYDSDVISTSFFLRTLFHAEVRNEVSGRVMAYLLAQQNSDGSWSLQDNPNRVETTALVVNSIWLYRNVYHVSEALNDGVAYLAAQRGSDDLWSEIEGSALALSAILNVVVDRSNYLSSLTNFANLQNSDGSFDNDVYLTALGLRVLSAAQKPAPDEIIVKGRAIDGDTGLPLSNVQVELAGPQTLSQLTDNNGMFNWKNVEPGQYSLSLRRDGFSPITTSTNLQKGDQRDFGTLTLLKAVASPTTGTIIGTISVAADGSPLAGAMVTVTGVSDPAVTNSEGQFQLNNIPPGVVSIQAAAPNYATAVATANIVAGQTLVFSPNLSSLAEGQVVVEGVITDRETNEVLEGVVVFVEGAGNNTGATTDEFGRYEIPGLQAGDLSLSASLTGYQTINGSISTPKNARINFSPSLLLEGAPQEPVANSGIIGRVVDRQTGLALSGANISLTIDANMQSLISGTNGEFVFSGLNAGAAQLSISFTNYQTVTTTFELPENIILNSGDISLLKNGVVETAAVQGTVVDSRTNEPLAGVVINGQFASGNVNVVTDISGTFEFTNLTDADGVLLFELEDYNSTEFGLRLTFNESLNIGQVRLRPEEIVELIPDLELQSLSASSVITNLQELTIGGSVSARVLNRGNAEVEFATTAIAFLDVDNSNSFDLGVDDLLGHTTMPEQIGVDQAISLVIPVSGRVPFRDAPIHVWIDSEQALVETDEDNNIASTADQCQPGQCPVGTADSQAFEPVLKWHWNAESVLSVPLVGPLVDTNKDGIIDRQDDPVIVFSSFSGFVDSSTATLRAINGRTGEEIWNLSNTNLRTEGSTHAAMGDLNNDGIPEIVMFIRNGGVAAINNDGSLLWQSSVPARPGGCCQYGAINIADIDADGSPEILARTHVLNSDGTVKWVAPINFAHLVSGLAVDLDLDGKLEVVLGNHAYRSDGTPLWEAPGTSIFHTGFGNFDDDAFPEIVAVGNSTVNLIDNDGTPIWSVAIPSNRRFGGAPTIADVDGDGIPEIGVAGSDVYVVYNEDGSILWSRPVRDFSSSNTGSTVFDFDGDNKAEIVYADELVLRVYDGTTGDVVFEIPNRSATATEYPVVADIDGDNHAELLVVSDGGGSRGLRAFEDVNDSWVNTRRIWNQYHYHIDNINEDGTVPVIPNRSWQTHNTFRLNTFPECKLDSKELAPIVKWHWQNSTVEPRNNGVYGPTTVGQLTDDNGDGVIDINDTPDVIFGSFQFGGPVGILNAVSGSDGSEIWSTRGFDITRFGSTAIGDIDGDSIVEIIVVNDNRSELFAFEHDGSLKWRVSSGPSRSSPRDAIAIADLDGDGSPEIIHGRRVHNADGSLRWVGAGGSGDNSNYGYVPTVADINLDGSPEVIAGRTVYSAEGEILWNRTDISGDGYTAIGNFDDDDFAEIVLVSLGKVYLLEHNGETIWGPIGLPGGGLGGPPTVSDLDGDGQPEIGIAGARNYVTFETDGSVLWTSPTQDVSSNRTGSSVFDFNGDGRVEVLYGDELFFRIYDGINGEVLYEIENISGTTLEYPIVADIDGDNHAEIVVTSSSNGPTSGVRAFDSRNNSWANTRRIWNQHTYHINNINEDGTIPRQEEPSWLSHNTYRLNTFPGQNVLALPDLTASQLKVIDQGETLSLTARIGNGGGARSLSGTALHFYNGNPSSGGALLAEKALPIIEPGQFSDVVVDNIIAINSGDTIYVIVDPENRMEECREDNNQMSTVALGLSGEISLSLNGNIFSSNSEITLDSLVTNTGVLEGSYRASLDIFDNAGDRVAGVADFNVTALASSQSAQFNHQWNTGTTLAGEYTARATLFDINSRVLDTADANFSISDLTDPDGTPNGDLVAGLRAATDRPFYHVDDRVQLDALAENTTTIHPIEDPQLILVVKDANGSEIFSETVALPSLAPGQITTATRSLVLQQAQEGAYHYQVSLLGHGGVTLAIANTSFEVLNDLNAAIRGEVTARASEVTQGEPQSCTFTTFNSGTQDLSDLPVQYRVVNVDAQTIALNESASLNLEASGTTRQLQSFATNNLAPGNYACVHEAILDGESRVLDYVQFTVLEAPIKITGSLTIGDRGRILILMDADGPDPHGQSSTTGTIPNIEQQRTFVSELLTEAGWTYTIVQSASEFDTELRSNKYAAYLLLSEHVKLNKETQNTLINHVSLGDGLLIGGHDRRNRFIEDGLGLSVRGNSAQAGGVSLEQNELEEPFGSGSQLDFEVFGKVLTFEPDGAFVFGQFTSLSEEGNGNGNGKGKSKNASNANTNAVASYRHGEGQTLFIGFDLAVNATLASESQENDANSFAQLVLSGLEFIHPQQVPLRSGKLIPLDITIHNLQKATIAQLILTHSMSLSVYKAQGFQITESGAWISERSMADDSETSERIWLQLLESPSSNVVSIQINALHGDDILPQEQITVQIDAP